jgi:uncharacterized protein YndB with AHSA1/START domain
MTTMYPCERVELSFIQSAPFRFSNSVDLAITPEQLFEVLADADSWPRWAKVITKVTWTSPEPYGVGTTRVVDMRGGLTGDEEFLAWEPYTYLAFRFNSCSNKAVAAFAEEYRVVETPGGCRLTWTMAQKPNGPARFGLVLGGPLMNLSFKWFLANLRRYTAAQYA